MSEVHPPISAPSPPKAPQKAQAPLRKIPGWALWTGVLVLALGVGLGIGAIVSGKGDDSGPVDNGEPAWLTDATSPEYQLQFSTGQGPRILDKQGNPIVDLGLEWWGDYGPSEGEAGCAVTDACTESERQRLGNWQHDTKGNQHHFTSTHEGSCATVEAHWTATEGDPRLALELSLSWKGECWVDREAVQWRLFDRPAVMGRDLKFTPVAKDKRIVVDRWTPHRAIAGAGDRAVQIHAWGFDGMDVLGDQTGGTLTLEIDDARNHPFRPMADCSDPAGREQRTALDRAARSAGQTLKLRAEVWIGHTWGPTVVRTPEGRQAALALLDDAKSPEVRHLKALLWGHSDPNDPRYGNGGLVGQQIPLTRALPGSTTPEAHEKMLEVAANAHALGMRFAMTGPPGSTDLGKIEARTWIDRFESCDDFHGEGWKGQDTPPKSPLYVWSGQENRLDGGGLNLLQPLQRDRRAPIMWSHARSEGPVRLFRTSPLNGGRVEVLRRVLTQDALDRLIRERGIMIGRTAWDQAATDPNLGSLDGYIVPEKSGHFVVAGELETRLFEMQHLVEKGDLWIAPIEALGDRLWTTARIEMSPLSDGRIRVTNPTDSDIAHLTISLPGNGYAVHLEEGKVTGERELSLSRGQTETWVWFDLAAGQTATLTVTDGNGYRLQPLIPVRWRVTEGAQASL